jgi:hypothetical protein
VIGKAADVAFKTTGKVILQGWRIVFEDPNSKEADLLPDFIKAKRTTQPSF